MAQKIDLSTIVLRNLDKKYRTVGYDSYFRYWCSIITAVDSVTSGYDRYVVFPDSSQMGLMECYDFMREYEGNLKTFSDNHWMKAEEKRAAAEKMTKEKWGID